MIVTYDPSTLGEPAYLVRLENDPPTKFFFVRHSECMKSFPFQLKMFLHCSNVKFKNDLYRYNVHLGNLDFLSKFRNDSREPNPVSGGPNMNFKQ